MVIEDISSILRQEAEAVLNIPVVAEYNEAVTLIVEYVHNRNGKLITSGMGKAGQIASNLAAHHLSFCIQVPRSTATREVFATMTLSCIYPIRGRQEN